MTWILFKNIPPEFYGIDRKKWEQEQQRRTFVRRTIPIESLEESLKRGGKLIEKQGEIAIVEEPSIKMDTAGKLFEAIPDKEKKDALFLEEILKVFKFEKKELSTPCFSFYSPEEEKKLTGYFVQIENGQKKIVEKNEVIHVGSKQIIFLLSLRDKLNGIITLSYSFDGKRFVFENIVLDRKTEFSNPEELLKKYNLPKDFEVNIF